MTDPSEHGWGDVVLLVLVSIVLAIAYLIAINMYGCFPAGNRPTHF